LTKPIPKIYTTRFFQLVTARQFAEAERILERAKQKTHVNERNRGYFQALHGMLLTKKNNDDRYAFMSGIELTDKKHLKDYRKEFLSHVESRLHAEYDRGFFEAWADYMKVLQKLELPAPTADKNSAKKEVEPTIETKEKTTKPIVNENKEKVEQETPDETKQKEAPTKARASEIEQIEPHQSTLFEFDK
jgi:hypothetical protein